MTCGMGARARALGAGRGAALLRRTPLMSCGILINEKIPRGKTHGNRTADFVSPSSVFVTVAYARASNSHLALDGTFRDSS